MKDRVILTNKEARQIRNDVFDNLDPKQEHYSETIIDIIHDINVSVSLRSYQLLFYQIGKMIGMRYGHEVADQREAEYISKIEAFEKWLALGTPFESAKFDHQKVLDKYREFFQLNVNKEKDKKRKAAKLVPSTQQDGVQ